MTETREAPTPREAWPHRVGDYLGSAVCQNCDMPWPCPSQRYLDGIVAALDKAARFQHGVGPLLLNGTAGRVHTVPFEDCPDPECSGYRTLLDPEPKP